MLDQLYFKAFLNPSSEENWDSLQWHWPLNKTQTWFEEEP